MEVTALTLVNRLLRRHRMDDVSVFTSPEAKLALDLVNTSIRDLLAERDYPWNVRSDGALTLLPTITGTTGLNLSISNPSAGNITGFTGAVGTVAGNFVTRLLATGGSHPTTALVIESLTLVGTLLAFNLNGDWPGDAVSSGAYKLFISEYLLPDTVAKVISVRHQGTPVQLLPVEPHATWDSLMPRPHDTEDDQPRVIGVGGTAVATYNTTAVTTPNRRLRLMVWPIPNDTALLNYTYKERVTELAEVDDVLYVPDEFADDIVNRAEMYSYANAFGNDPDLAAFQGRIGMANATMKYGNSRLDPQRRHVVSALDSGNGRRRDFTPYRDIDGL